MIHAHVIALVVFGLLLVVWLFVAVWLRIVRKSFAEHRPSWLTELTVKIVTEAISALGILALLTPDLFGSHFPELTQEPQKTAWVWVKLFAVVTGVLWKMLGFYLDANLKNAVIAQQVIDAEKQRDAAEDRSQLYSDMLGTLQSYLDDRILQFETVMEEGTKAGLKPFKKAMAPRMSIVNLLAAMVEVLLGQFHDGLSSGVNIRVGLYIESRRGKSESNFLEAFSVYDRKRSSSVVFRSFRDFPEAFLVDDNPSRSIAVKCLRQKRPMFVPDTKDAEKSGTFSFLHENQRAYLLSMVAYPVGRVCTGWGMHRNAVFVLDSDCLGLFDESRLEEFQVILDEFRERIRLELLMVHTMGTGS